MGDGDVSIVCNLRQVISELRDDMANHREDGPFIIVRSKMLSADERQRLLDETARWLDAVELAPPFTFRWAFEPEDVISISVIGKKSLQHVNRFVTYDEAFSGILPYVVIEAAATWHDLYSHTDAKEGTDE